MILNAVMKSETLGGDDEIMRLRNGDFDALSEVIARYQHRLYRYLLHLTRDSSTAEDLFQQTWLRVMEKIGRYDRERRFDLWLFSVARNLAMDHFRSRRPMESLDDVGESGVKRSERVPGRDTDTLTRVLDSERSAILSECILVMPPIHREILALRFEEDMKLEEIAEIAEIPLSTVKSRLSRALAGLRSRVVARMAEGER